MVIQVKVFSSQGSNPDPDYNDIYPDPQPWQCLRRCYGNTDSSDNLTKHHYILFIDIFYTIHIINNNVLCAFFAIMSSSNTIF